MARVWPTVGAAAFLLSCLVHSALGTGCAYLGNCNGHGDCNALTYTCSCYEGWGAATDIAIFKAPDCSLRTFVYAVAAAVWLSVRAGCGEVAGGLSDNVCLCRDLPL